MRKGVSRQHRRGAGFSLIEILFAIAMLGVGIVSILALFATGIRSATSSGNATVAAMEIQSLVARILAEEDPSTPGKRIFLERIQPTGGGRGQEWIHCDETFAFASDETPVRIDSKRDLWWKCRVLPVKSDRSFKNAPKNGNANQAVYLGELPKNGWKPPMNPDDPFIPERFDSEMGMDFKDVPGLYEVAIAVYKNYKEGKQPIAWYTTFVTAGY